MPKVKKMKKKKKAARRPVPQVTPKPRRRPQQKYDSRKKRIDEEQIIHDVRFEMEASSTFKHFDETICGLYGVPGIGKSRFAELLGLELQRKYLLKQSGVYFLQCEPINHPWKIRKSFLPNWPTFRDFVDRVEKDPAFVSTVKMWVIDTIDGIIPKAIDTICCDFGITDMKEGTISIGNNAWHAQAWQEFRKEVLYQILRLVALGPGMLILSHERYRKVVMHRTTIDKASMDLSDKVYNALGDACSIVFRMRHVDEQSNARCLAFLPSDEEDAKDNLNVLTPKYPKGVVPFKNEKEAVKKTLACFE